MEKEKLLEKLSKCHGFKDKVRIIISNCIYLNAALTSLRRKDQFVDFVYDIWIRPYSSNKVKKSAFEEILSKHLEIFSDEDVSLRQSEYNFFLDIISYVNMSPRQKAIFNEIGYKLLTYAL